MTLQELEVRLRTLEDIEEINKLQRAYGYYLEHWEGQHIVELFSNSNNVSVEANRKGVYLGQEGIKYFFLTDKVSPELSTLTQVVKRQRGDGMVSVLRQCL